MQPNVQAERFVHFLMCLIFHKIILKVIGHRILNVEMFRRNILWVTKIKINAAPTFKRNVLYATKKGFPKVIINSLGKIFLEACLS